ncbi:hypothetical protein M378DRAFT_10880 [Amanita muscaria Koide BX008]|uniref:NACHT domain-containing protein n=1 Tax=Amanita muscaria (strain Koide BX008) TaxID=946122 RepID=A0A0C2SPR5_AMAMK|nr:hypothetical protein M378DRAFT_10880 [Amanita muscaria Koide BX008]
MRGCRVLPDIPEELERHFLIQSIKDLPRAEAAHNDYQSQKKSGPCLEGTREALLAELGGWIIDRNKRIYVLSGLAGIGKSTIAYTIAARADKLGILGASFFFSRDEFNRKSAKKLFTTIAFQLCVHDKEFAQAIGKVLDTGKGVAAVTRNISEQLRALILEPLRSIVRSRNRPTVIVIDALDECDDGDAPAVLISLEQLVRELPSFKVLLTTRPQPHIDRLLNSHDVFYLHNIEDKVVNGDIRRYLEFSLSRENVDKCLPGRSEEWSADDEEIGYLVAAVGKLFIIAYTLVCIILDTTVCDPASQLDELKTNGRLDFGDLESFYTVILRRVIPERKYSTKILERFKTVMGTILFVQEPLPMQALQHLSFPYVLGDIEAVLSNLKSVITVQDNKPRIYHQSFPDFLLSETFHERFNSRLVPGDQHRRLAMLCLKIMNERLKQNILDLQGAARFKNNADALQEQGISQDQLREAIPDELLYACKFWSAHIEGAYVMDLNTLDHDLIRELATFANSHLMHWFEVLSLIDELCLAPRALRTVINFPKLISTDLNQLLTDALRFISKFYATIEKSALHTYHSALPFTPTESLLYKGYHQQMINNICEIQGGPKEWNAVISNLRCPVGSVRRILFSQDSTMLSCVGDGGLNVWDSATGTPIGAIRGNYSAIADDFSLAAASKGSAITLYDVKRCLPVATLSNPSTNIDRLTISSDGSRFATSSSGGTVDLWDSKKGDVVARFDGLGALKFTPSGANLVFRSGDCMKLLDATNGKLVADLNYRQYHSCENIVKPVFSSDGSRLAYISAKRRSDLDNFLGWPSSGVLTLWISEKSESWTCAGSTTENVDAVLAMSADGSLIATIGYRGNRWGVLLLSGNSGNPLNLVRVLEQSVGRSAYSLAISRDGILAIGLKGAVILYDTKNYTFVSRLPSPTLQYIVEAVAFSPDCTRAAAATVTSEHRGITAVTQLWDLQAVKATSPFTDGLVNKLTVLFFSPDCSHLASGYEDGTVRLWDTCHNRRPITTFKASSVRVTAFAFSTDGLQLASGSEDGTIKLWNIRDGSAVCSLQHHKSIKAMVILAGALAIECSDHHVTLWNLTAQRSIATISKSAGGLWSLGNHDTLFAYCDFRRGNFGINNYYWTLWDAEKHREFATVVHGCHDFGTMALSLDKSKLVVEHKDKCLFEVFNVIDGKIRPETGQDNHGHLPLIRRWHGIPVWLKDSYSLGAEHVMGQFSPGEVPIPVVFIPEELRTAIVAHGSSMFALGSKDGYITILRSFSAE